MVGSALDVLRSTHSSINMHRGMRGNSTEELRAPSRRSRRDGSQRASVVEKVPDAKHRASLPRNKLSKEEIASGSPGHVTVVVSRGRLCEAADSVLRAASSPSSSSSMVIGGRCCR
eukprot:3392098-Rhodomonas_salina.1